MVTGTEVIAVGTVVGLAAGGARWINGKRWDGVRSADEQEDYLRDRFEGSKYAGGPLSGTVTTIITEEDTGVLYQIKKSALAEVSGSTKITIRVDRAAISENRLDKEPFKTIFSDPSEMGLSDAEHIRTDLNKQQGYTLVQVRVHSTDFDDVGSWCAAIPELLWDVHQYEQQM